MSKTRLDESTIRRFQALANIPALGNINEMSYARDDEALPGAEDADPMADEPMDEPVEEEAPEEVADTGEVDVLSLVNAIADAITTETGVEVTASEDAEGEAPAEEEPLEEPAEEDPMAGGEELGGEEEPMMEVERDLAAADVYLDNTANLVNEVTRRVARRLLRNSARGK